MQADEGFKKSASEGLCLIGPDVRRMTTLVQNRLR
jgi:hypothetical protein